MNTMNRLDKLQTAFNAVVWARGAHDLRGETIAESRLFDACIADGMSVDECDHVEWAAIRINDLMAEGAL